MAILRLHDDLWERCVAVARAALPNEACALVSGQLEGVDELGERYVITGIHPVVNSLRSPTAFALDGHGMIAAEQSIEAAGLHLLGVLHSHPTSKAFPSARDLADASVYDPDAFLVQMIVSLQGFSPTIRAFRFEGTAGSSQVEFQLVAGTRP